MKIRLFIVALTACASFSFIHAQTLAKPAEPNEICMEAWNNYRKADALWKTGWGLFGAGQALAIGGGLLYALTINWGLPPDEVPAWQPAACTSGFTIMIIGAGMTVASIPCLAVGQVRRKAAQSEYNKKCTSDTPITFSLQSSANGLGIAMNF